MTVTLGAIVVLVLGTTLMIGSQSAFAQTESRSMIPGFPDFVIPGACLA
jgi:hypothetical protein